MFFSHTMTTQRILALLPDLLTAGVAVAVWLVFYPGLLSHDSVVQIGQALSGRFTDWHPPLMSVVMSLVLRAGAPVSLLLLGQCLAGAFGVRAFVAACLRQLRPEISRTRAAWLSFLALLLLLVPVSPLAFYLMTLWKDAWAMVILLWFGAFALADRRWGWQILLPLALAVALGLIRHNAVAALPFAGLVLWEKTRRSAGRARALALGAAPLLLWLATEPLFDLTFNVKQEHPDSQIIALDLIGLCAEGPEVCEQLPYTRRHIRAPDTSFYRPGDLGPIYWQEPRPVDPAFFADYAALKAELVHAAREVPLELAEVKAEAFVTLLGIDATFYFVHTTMTENRYGLTLNRRFERPRRWLTDRVGMVAAHPVLRWISGVHLVWLVAGILWIVGLLVARRRLLAFVLCVPLGYYLSYLLAAPVHDFRFMYPATLAVQCVTFAGLAALIPQKPSGRAPNLSRFPA